MSKASKNPIRIPATTSEDQPATRKMLKLVRNELVEKMGAGFKRVDGEFIEVRASIDRIERRLSTRIDNHQKDTQASFEKMQLTIEEHGAQTRASLTTMQLLLEEQNANNRIVLEGLQSLWQRQDRIEKESLERRP